MKKILLRLLLAIGVFILILVINLLIFNLSATRITEGVPITKTASAQTALLVIDIQEGTTGSVSATDSYKKQSDAFIMEINQIVKEAREKNWTIIYVRSEVVNPLLNLLNNTMARGSKGAEFDERLFMASDLVITKRKNDSFRKTNLDQILLENHVDKLVMVGLDAAHCVKSVILAAHNRGYDLAVIPKGIIAKDEADKVRVMDEFRELGVEIIE